VWLAGYCSATADNDAPYWRPWRLLTAAWYAAQFNPAEGLAWLRQLSGGAATLSPADNQLLMEAAAQTSAQAPLLGLIAACPDAAVKTMLADFGHPDPAEVSAAALRRPPDYAHLAPLTARAPADAARFRQFSAAWTEAGLTPASGPLLSLACGPLAEQCVLFSSAGYKISGADLDIPPGYLPLAGVRDWFYRRKHAAAWQEATTAYYRALSHHAELSLNWGNASPKLADITRLPHADGSYAAVIVTNLHLLPDERGVLAEAARLLKPGGLLLANMAEGAARLAQIREALEQYFTVTCWEADIDQSPEIGLTGGQILGAVRRK
jgi:SAM-dependent methyltransferase